MTKWMSRRWESHWTAKPLVALLIIPILFVSISVVGAQSASEVDLKPELRQALLRDAQCGTKAGKTADREQFLSTVQAQPLHGPRGVEIGVIATPSDACHCPTTNCRNYVYVMSGDTYKLVLEENFESLRPTKMAKSGIPSLTGKVRVNTTTTENIILNWNGSAYSPSLCATVTQKKGTERPTIAYHACGPAPASKPDP